MASGVVVSVGIESVAVLMAFGVLVGEEGVGLTVEVAVACGVEVGGIEAAEGVGVGEMATRVTVIEGTGVICATGGVGLQAVKVMATRASIKTKRRNIKHSYQL
jgi:hypothetical protein